jgi:quercetin dioxygenase-like cupin family protein
MESLLDPRRCIANPVTGDRVEFLASPLLDSHAELTYRCTLAPHAAGSPAHVHRALTETFTVEQGSLLLSLGKVRRVLAPGETVRVDPGIAHAFRNASPQPVTFCSRVTPGDGFERFLRGMYGLAASGRTDAAGLPRDPRLLALLLEYADLRLAGVPDLLQRPLLGALGWVGRATGAARDLEAIVQPAGASHGEER